MKRICMALLVASASATTPLSAQIIFAPTSSGTIQYSVPTARSPQAVTLGPDGQPVPGAPQGPETPRLQKLKQLQFDRRPSVILKAWITPEPEKKKKEPTPAEAKDSKDAAAKPEAKAADGNVAAQKEDKAAEVKPEEKPAATTEKKEEAKSEDNKTEKPAEGSKVEGEKLTADDKVATSEDAAAKSPEKKTGSESAKGEDAPPKTSESDAKEQANSQAPATATDPAKSEEEKAKQEQLADQKKAAEEKAAAEKKAAEEKAKEAAKKAAEEKAKAEELEAELKAFQRNVTLGRWSEVKAYLAGLPAEEGKAGYLRLVQSLQENRAAAQQGSQFANMPQLMQYVEKNFFTIQDLLGVIQSAPGALEKDALTFLASIVSQALSSGNSVEMFVQRLKEETGKEKGIVTIRQAAKILTAAGQAADAGAFLPSLEQATKDQDVEGLGLLAKHLLAIYRKDGKYDDMQKAWDATQAALATGTGEEADREEALQRSIELAPKLKNDLGTAWLEQSYKQDPKRGREILSTLGSKVSQGIEKSPTDTGNRLEILKLQKIAAESLIKIAPDEAVKLGPELTLLAMNWGKEADFTYKNSRGEGMGPQMQRDLYGNFFYMDEEQMMDRMRQSNQPMPIAVLEILQAKPNDAWFALVDPGLKPRFDTLLAQLYLKGGEEEKAFPYIESLANAYPDRSKSLVGEFLRVWTNNHDPNATRRRTNPYFYFYGYEQRAESIPLTRSKQQRNLQELGKWVSRLREMQIGELDEDLLARAFTTCHSSAEVYKLDAIEQVFGPIGGLKPRTLAGLVANMRENLAGLWRQPAEQEKNKTKRKSKDIQIEVLRGYSVANHVLTDGLAKFPDSWELQTAKAAIAHDELNYRQELEKSSEFTKKRQAALAEFQTAAATYAKAVGSLKESEQSTRVYDLWFYASLGATELNNLNRDSVPDSRQPALIRAAITTLPAEIAERHMEQFANALFTRMGSVNPAMKFAYLKAGFEIVGDHKLAMDARKVYDYYKDLVTEIKLETVVDGNDAVGQEPFGLFVNLRHTREIERESGGFGRYLQNQNSMSFSYNYGRPTEDYRDKFQATVEQALGENFEIQSVTFQTEKVTSKATPEYGWRVTPYAYLLLKAKGPQIDKIAPLRLDLDFLDTSGYAVIPIESPALPIDAKVTKVDPRPARKLAVVQTLDERQAKEGKLILEVKATAVGLVPALDQLVTFEPQGFDIVKSEDQGVSVSKFDEDGDETAVVSERTWLLTLQAKPDLPERPKEFHFAATKLEGTDMTFQRYADADLVAAASLLPLEQKYGEPSKAWIWTTAAIGAGLLGLLTLGILTWRRPKNLKSDAMVLPDELTPFTVMGLLQRIQQNDGLSDVDRRELSTSLAQLEQHYFADSDRNGIPDLRQLAETWVNRSQ